MRAGRLRHQVALQRPTGTLNEFGDPVGTWSTIATLWAAVEPLSGREYLAGQTVQSEVSHRITVRYFAGITPRDRIVWTDPSTGLDRTFDIRAVIDRDERHAALEIMCTEHGRDLAQL